MFRAPRWELRRGGDRQRSGNILGSDSDTSPDTKRGATWLQRLKTWLIIPHRNIPGPPAQAQMRPSRPSLSRRKIRSRPSGKNSRVQSRLTPGGIDGDVPYFTAAREAL